MQWDLDERLTKTTLFAFDFGTKSLAYTISGIRFPFGTLEEQHRRRHSAYDKTLTIFRQSLSALEYLHKQETSIVHRYQTGKWPYLETRPTSYQAGRLRPCHSRGFSEDTLRSNHLPSSWIGQILWIADSTETWIHRRGGCLVTWRRYLTIRFGHDLPHPGESVGIGWCEKIIEEVDGWYRQDLINFLSTAMLIMEPESRYSAYACWDRVKELFVPSRGHGLISTPASCADENEMTN